MLFYVRIELDRSNVDSMSFQVHPDKMLRFQGFVGFRRVCRKFLNFRKSLENTETNVFFGFAGDSSQTVVTPRR